MKPFIYPDGNPGRVIHLLKKETTSKDHNRKLAISSGRNIQVIDLKKVSHFQSDNNYTKICFSSGLELLVSKTLKRFEEKVDPSHFLRIHNSYIINVDHISFFNTSNCTLKMKNETLIPVSRTRKHLINQYLKKLLV